jgi:Xaa-Pro aminopeptidase
MVQERQTEHKFGDKPYLGFEHVTMVPMCRKLLDPSLLTAEEKSWLNSYHQEIREKTTPLLQGKEIAMTWLLRETEPIS